MTDIVTAPDEVMAPDERALRCHLRGGRFQAGVEAGRWKLISLAWPFAIFGVSAAPREGAPSEFAIRFELNGYPNTAPTGGVWDVEAGTTLAAAQRPKGARVELVFRWEGGGCGPTAMYAPWDRVGLQSHANWAQEAPRLAWHAQREITFVLENIHELLNADDYLGI